MTAGKAAVLRKPAGTNTRRNAEPIEVARRRRRDGGNEEK